MSNTQQFVETLNADIRTLQKDFAIPEFENLRVVAIELELVSIEVAAIIDDEQSLCHDIVQCLYSLLGDYTPLFGYQIKLCALDTMDELEIFLDTLEPLTADEKNDHRQLLEGQPSQRFLGWNERRMESYKQYLQNLMH